MNYPFQDGAILARKVRKGNTLKNEKNLDVKKNVGEKPQNYITVFRQNIDKEIEKRDWTLRETAEKADMPYETLKNFLYDKEAKDCKLSTVVKLARAFGVGIDELVGAGTYKEDAIKYIKIYRELPESSKSLIKWHIEDQLRLRLHKEQHNRRIIRIMAPLCTANGNLRKTRFYEDYDLSDEYSKEEYYKVFFGIRIPCDHYLPFYMKNDILLIANDRSPMQDDVVVLVVGDFLAIAKHRLENGVIKYYGIRDGIFRAERSDNIHVLGYIAKVISE